MDDKMKSFSNSSPNHSTNFDTEKEIVEHAETAHQAAERGHVATDKYVCIWLTWSFVDCFSRYGRALVTFDPVAEARLLWKIDLYIIPTVSLLYLFCFIDRANIGEQRWL